MADPTSTPAPLANAVEIDAALVRQLADILNDTSLTEIEVERGELRIRVAREITAAPVMQYAAAPQFAAPAPAAAPTAAAASMPSDPATIVAKAGETVKSPMVGTAYLRPAPESAAFVEIGSVVKAGDKILLVEAMKTFNEIIAPKAGTVTRILVEDGTPVEYGQALFVIE